MHVTLEPSPEKRGMISIFGILLLLMSAVVGSFVLGMGSQEQTTQAPAVNLDFEADDAGTVTVTHEGGELLERSEIEVRSPGSVDEWPGTQITAGDEIVVSGLESGDTVQVVWHAPDGDASAILAQYDVP